VLRLDIGMPPEGKSVEQLSTMFRANKRANKFHLGHIVKLETQLREKIRSQGKADSTADAYWYWIERFLRFAKSKRGEWVLPADMGRRQVYVAIRV